MMFTGTLTNFDGSWTCEVAGEWTVTKGAESKRTVWSGWLQAIDRSTIREDELYILDLMDGQLTTIRLLRPNKQSSNDTRLRFEGTGRVPAGAPVRTENVERRVGSKIVA